MSFGPIRQRRINLFVGASRVPAKPLGEDGILNQNPIFETGPNNRYHANLPEVNQMSKARDTKKSEKKKPQKTAKEKRKAKREKKNK